MIDKDIAKIETETYGNIPQRKHFYINHIGII